VGRFPRQLRRAPPPAIAPEAWSSPLLITLATPPRVGLLPAPSPPPPPAGRKSSRFRVGARVRVSERVRGRTII
jgi:hypothetical protein